MGQFTPKIKAIYCSSNQSTATEMFTLLVVLTKKKQLLLSRNHDLITQDNLQTLV